jgi:hypothetical protein
MSHWSEAAVNEPHFMGVNGNRYKLAAGNIPCPGCDQNPEVREGGQVVARCLTCKGVDQVPVLARRGPMANTRRHRMQTIHTLAHYLAEGHDFIAWEETASSDRGTCSATRVTITVSLSAQQFHRTWQEVAAKKGWKR